MVLKKYKWGYHTPWLAKRQLRWRALINPDNWSRWVYPSYRMFLREWGANLCVFLTPWYRWRRNLITAFFEENCTKLLDYGHNFAYVRTRNRDVAYYTLRCGLVTARLERSQLIDKKSGEPRNIFIESLLANKTIDDYEDVLTTVLSGPAITRKQCQRLLDRIIEATPDMEWQDYGED